MLFLRRPTDSKIRELLDRHGAMPFSYAEVGATRSGPPTGYRINHMRARVGNGKDVYGRAAKALFAWQLLGVGGIEAFPAEEPVTPGTKVPMPQRQVAVSYLDPGPRDLLHRVASGQLRSLVRDFFVLAAGKSPDSAGEPARPQSATAIRRGVAPCRARIRFEGIG